MYGGLTAAQLLRLLAVVAILILAFGRDVGACRAILVVLAVIIVCACGACGTGYAAGIGTGVGAYTAGYGVAPYGTAYHDGF